MAEEPHYSIIQSWHRAVLHQRAVSATASPTSYPMSAVLTIAPFPPDVWSVISLCWNSEGLVVMSYGREVIQQLPSDGLLLSFFFLCCLFFARSRASGLDSLGLTQHFVRLVRLSTLVSFRLDDSYVPTDTTATVYCPLHTILGTMPCLQFLFVCVRPSMGFLDRFWFFPFTTFSLPLLVPLLMYLDLTGDLSQMRSAMDYLSPPELCPLSTVHLYFTHSDISILRPDLRSVPALYDEISLHCQQLLLDPTLSRVVTSRMHAPRRRLTIHASWELVPQSHPSVRTHSPFIDFVSDSNVL